LLRKEPVQPVRESGELPTKRRKHVPLRSCIACRTKSPKRDLIRVVRTPEGTLEVDTQGKRAGRGAYLCSKRECGEIALHPGRLSRALKCQVNAADVAALKASILALIEETAVESEMAPADGASIQG
jgi:predicted RNA-binding protein YlxR (DUF448 family)